MEPTPAHVRTLFVVFLLAMFPAGMASRPVADPDTWWHLRVGETIVETGTFPPTEPFSRYGIETQKPWIAYSWLYEVVLYGFWHTGGIVGVLVFRLLMDACTFATISWVILKRCPSPWMGIGVLGSITICILPLMAERPWHFTIVFTLLSLEAMLDLRRGGSVRNWAWLPLTYVLWANIHIQFVMGLGVLGLGLVAGILDRSCGRRAAIGSHLALLTACFAATFANPYTWQLYRIVVEYASETTPLRLVMELRPPDFSHWANWPLVGLLLLAGVSLATRGFPLMPTLLLLTGLVFSMRMQRDIWFGAVLSGYALCRSDSPLLPDAFDKLRSPRRLAQAIVCGFALMAGLRAGFQTSSPGADEAKKDYPVEAVEFVRANPLPGPMYNDFTWGGYLIWNLREYPVSMDGRTNLHGEVRLQRSFDTWGGLAGWDTDPELLEAGFVLAAKGMPLSDLLRTDARFRIAYEDDTAIVFVRVRG